MAEITATAFPIKLGDVTYKMSPLNDIDSEEINNWLRSRVIDMAVRSIPKDASKETRREIIDVAIAQARSLSWDREGAEIMGTIDGVTRVLWQGIQKNHKDLTFEEFRSKLFDPNLMQMTLSVWEEINLQGMGGDASRGKRKGSKKRRRRKKRSTRA